MHDDLYVTSYHAAPGDRDLGEPAAAAEQPHQGHMLDGPQARRELRQLLEWWYAERDKQAANRLEQAIDADFYDGLQWTPEDARTLRERGQMPLVYNEIAPMCDWLIGTERRTRVDWRVMPRAEDDVEMADVKTKVLKYVSDLNRVSFARSRAFADAVKSGVGWVDDGVRDDPTQDIIYSRHEDWRCVLWDSASLEPDLSDARYIFRWRWVDEDVALAMFPGREDCIRRAVDGSASTGLDGWDEDDWQTQDDDAVGKHGPLRASGAGMMLDTKRRRVRLIECQYRKPVKAKIICDGPLKGLYLHDSDEALKQALMQCGGSIVERVAMRVHVAIFTEAHMLALGPSVYRHNRFSLTPIWCYRRGRDRMPYGVIRRVRDIQQDLNKRASKALFLLNTNQIIADEGATDDWAALRDEADRPDGLIIKKPNKDISIRRDSDAANGQMQMMTLDANAIHKIAGVAQENLGRATNAVSGIAIQARQLQGSVVTTEPFDNLRLAVQVSGEKQLSLIEQFYTEEKVIRLTGTKGAMEWAKINVPEQQADGTWRFVNDIAASMGDFVVAETDYAGTMRQVLFDALNALATRLPPEIALRIMTIAMEFSDLPNKDAVAEQFRKVTGERDPDKPMTPEEEAQAQQQMQMQAEALELQRQTAMLALQEQQAKVREISARAAKIEMEIKTAMSGDGGQLQAAMERDLMQVRAQAADEVARVAEQLRQAQLELANRSLAIAAESDAKTQTARIDADARVRVAEIQAASDERIKQMQDRLEQSVPSMAPSAQPQRTQP